MQQFRHEHRHLLKREVRRQFLPLRAPTAAARVLKQEEPFHCIRCDKPFGVKSTIERVVVKLEGWVYRNSANRLDVTKMRHDCRVSVATKEDFEPYRTPARPKPRTTEDYLRAREIKSDV